MAASNIDNSNSSSINNNNKNKDTLTTVEDRDGWTIVNYGNDDVIIDDEDGFLVAGRTSNATSGDSSVSAEALRTLTPTDAEDDDEAAAGEAPAPAPTARAAVAAAAAASGHRGLSASAASSSSTAVSLCHSAAFRAAARTRAKQELSRSSLARKNQVATLRCSSGSGASSKRQLKMRGTVKCPQARSASKKC